MAELRLTYLSTFSAVLQREVPAPSPVASQGIALIAAARLSHCVDVGELLDLCDDARGSNKDTISVLGVPVSVGSLLDVLDAGGIVLRWNQGQTTRPAQIGVLGIEGQESVVIDDGSARVCLVRLAEAPGDTPKLPVQELPRGHLRIVPREEASRG